ncbi:MAG TPA: hypothetical protein VIE43_12460 [Thermoanaerobaculia bacterium]|jgi:hypothetical protein|nr:hypothetical protein [Thermoanaerobaculia bacterium]
MKTRLMLLIFVVLLASSALAGAATEPASLPAVAPAPSLALVASPACAANASTLNLPGLLPNAIFASTICGACSQNPCKNQTVNTTCFVSNKRGSCQSPDETTCSGTTAPNCLCYVGNL